MELQLHGERLSSLLLDEGIGVVVGAASKETSAPISLTSTFEVGRTGPDAKIVIEPGNNGKRPGADPNLVKLLAQAHRYNSIFVRGGRSITEMAREMGVTRSYFTRVLRLSFLAPAITRSIVLGRQPQAVSVSALVSNSRFPVLWKDQLAALGFA